MNVFADSPYSVKDYQFINKFIDTAGYESRLYKRQDGKESSLVYPILAGGNIWNEYSLPDISTETLNERIKNGKILGKLVSKGKILTAGMAFYLYYNGIIKINKIDYSELPLEWKPKVQVFRIYKEGYVDFKFRIASASKPRPVPIYDFTLGGYIPDNVDFYFLVRSKFDSNTNNGIVSTFDDYFLYKDGSQTVFNFYPKQNLPFTDPDPALSGPNTSTMSGLSPTAPKVDALAASAQKSVPTTPSVSTTGFSPLSTVNAKVDVQTGESTPIINATGSPYVSSISSQAPTVNTPTIPSTPVPSVSLPSVPTVSIPTSAVPTGVPTIPSTTSLSNNISNSTQGGINRLQIISIPKLPTMSDINSKFEGLI